ncbi:hypothetical protein B7P02_15575 [Bordetella bronchiseptica]|uniref:DUF3363 domain-containing protein n=1 Tax=Bordetella bronchiseptica TaxID=518 RepID=UPI000D734FBA|nr:DUF3363 domain-containing protein [Bordetella bronchiseptica]AWP59347.1 hypothetical protein B7P02_15575 [Bordetella bronchiseptica]
MAEDDSDRLRVRPAPPRASKRSGGERFVTTVLRQASRVGPGLGGRSSGAAGRGLGGGPRRGQNFGRGRVAARMEARQAHPSHRRVIIKSRFVRLHKGSAAIGRHLRYIQRDGVTREGEAGQAYDADRDAADTGDFEARSRDDRHQFRFIVSPEDAEDLGELRDYTRKLMRQMEVDLETRLDWVAVDHWDTDNPHTHIVLRGRTDHGQDLVIAPEYMSQGMRDRAVQIATQWLGPRTGLEIEQSLQREVGQARLTSLDRTLLRAAPDHVVDMTKPVGDMRQQRLLRARLQVLVRMGLAREAGMQRWHLAQELAPRLQALGERGDIIKTLHRALRGQAREWVVDGPAANAGIATPVVGCVVGKGLADELRDTGYLALDGVDGRAHYVRLSPGMDLSQFAPGSIVEVRPTQDSAADRQIATVARGGVYRTDDAMARLKGKELAAGQSVQGQVRRLEVLRRAQIVQRIDDGVWRVPSDLVAKGRAYDHQRTAGVEVLTRSTLPLAEQVKALGATWLDTQLVSADKAVAHTGFGERVHAALQARTEHLIDQGLASRRGQRVLMARNLLATLKGRELEVASKKLAQETGCAYRPLGQRDTVSGVYRQSVNLASGRFAVVDDGKQFSLVPWRPVIEQRLGQTLTATVAGGRVDWSWGRQRGIGR